MILFYYEMIREEKDFTIWIRNIRRVHKRIIRYYSHLINDKKYFIIWTKNIGKVNEQFMDNIFEID